MITPVIPPKAGKSAGRRLTKVPAGLAATVDLRQRAKDVVVAGSAWSWPGMRGCGRE